MAVSPGYLGLDTFTFPAIAPGGGAAIDTPTLTVVDEETGGAFTATVADSTPEATNTLYAGRVTGELGPIAFVEVGDRDGDGDITGTVEKGYYWWYVHSNLEGAESRSDLVFQVISDGAADVQARVIAAVAARIALLALPGLARVYAEKLPWDGDLEFPCAIVTDFNQAEAMLGGTTGHDYYGRPAFVMFRANDAHDRVMVVDGVEVDAGNLLRLWRGKTIRSFQGQRLPGVDEVQWCEVEPAQITILAPDATEVIVSGLTIRAHTRENRGFGV